MRKVTELDLRSGRSLAAYMNGFTISLVVSDGVRDAGQNLGRIHRLPKKRIFVASCQIMMTHV